MNKIASTEEYSTRVKNAKQRLKGAITNCYVLLDHADEAIQESSLIYAETDEALSLLFREPERYRCYFYAAPRADVRLGITPMDMPICAELIYPANRRPDIAQDILLHNGFRFVRTMFYYSKDMRGVSVADMEQIPPLSYAMPDDREQIMGMIQAAFDMTLDEILTSKELEQAIADGRVLTVREAAFPVAAAVLVEAGNAIGLRTLVVDPRYRNKGYGLRLARQVQKVASIRGKRQIFIWVVENNAIAQATYAKAGYILDQRRCDDYLL